jgi:hypothetical protein
MPDQILHKRSLTTGSIPTTSSLNVGEIALNVPDGKIYLHKSGSTGQSIESAITSNSTSSIGILTMSGSLILSGSSNINSGSVFDVSADNISFDFDILSFSGSAQITGSLVVTQGITGSLQGTSSWASNAVTASYAETSALTNNAYFAQGILNATQGIPDSSDTVIQFVDQFDPQGWWDGTKSQFLPNIAGYYTVSLGVTLENTSNNTGYVQIQILKNGNTIEMQCRQPLNNTSDSSLFGSKIIYLDGNTDYLEFIVYQSSGGTFNILKGPGGQSPDTWFSATYMTM